MIDKPVTSLFMLFKIRHLQHGSFWKRIQTYADGLSRFEVSYRNVILIVLTSNKGQQNRRA